MTKIDGVANNGWDRAVIQNNMDHSLKWAHSNKMHFNTGNSRSKIPHNKKCKSCYERYV